MEKESLLASLKVADEIDAVVYSESRDHMYVYNSQNPLHADFAYRWAMNPEVVERAYNGNRYQKHGYSLRSPGRHENGLTDNDLYR